MLKDKKKSHVNTLKFSISADSPKSRITPCAHLDASSPYSVQVSNIPQERVFNDGLCNKCSVTNDGSNDRLEHADGEEEQPVAGSGGQQLGR